MTWNLDEAIGYFRTQGAPGDQTALISLLREVQQEQGGSIPTWAVGQIAAAYQLKDSFLQALIRRIPSLRLGDTHCLELCGGPNCGKHTTLAAAAERLQKTSKIPFTIRYVPCMRMCGKGPNIRWDGKLHHRADETLLRSLLEEGT